MGLPVWRDPDEAKNDTATKRDPSATSRSSIRRRPSVHGRRTAAHMPPRLTRSPIPSTYDEAQSRDALRAIRRAIPPVSTLFETVDSPAHSDLPLFESAFRPPAIREPRRLRLSARTLVERGSQLESNMRRLQQSVSRLGERAATMQASLQDSLSTDRFGQIPRPLHRWTFSRPDEEPSARPREPRSRARRWVDDDLPSDSHVRSARPSIRLPTPPPRMSDEPETARHTNNITGRTFRRSPSAITLPPRQPASVVNGLGDRNRSPTPTDGWDLIRTTITPDVTLPSADSSFASAAASRSFASSSATSINGLETNPSSLDMYDGAADADPIDLFCDSDAALNAEFAEDMYYDEMRTPEGRERIAYHQNLFRAQGRSFALGHEPSRVEIGFRLIDSALDSSEGRMRVHQLLQTLGRFDDSDDYIFGGRRYVPTILGDEHNDGALGGLADGPNNYTTERPTRPSSIVGTPPAHQNPLGSHPVNGPPTYISAMPSRAGSPQAQIRVDELLDTLINSDMQDMNAMRRIVERLAARDDVPEEWWMSLGLNLSRTQVRNLASDGWPRQSSDRVLTENDNSTGDDGPGAERDLARH